MTLQEINNGLNSSVQVLVGEKMEYGQIHDNVRSIVRDLGINFGYRVWDVYHKSNEYLSIFSIKLDTLDDARSKHKRVGKIQSIKFILNFPEFAELTVSELFKHHERNEKLQNIAYIKESILKREQEIQELKESLAEAEKELNS